MAKPEFSETQFVFGFLKELYKRRSVIHPWDYFMFPSTSIEKLLPVDFFVDYYSHSEYYQFKRSDYLFGRRGAAEIDAGLPASYLPYFRFHVYNKETMTKSGAVLSGQFDSLRKLAAAFKGDLICYVAPCFHLEGEFHQYFKNDEILNHSIIIECNQFNDSRFLPPKFDINDGEEHYVTYKLKSHIGYICSEAEEIKAQIATEILRFSQEKEKGDLVSTVRALYQDFYLSDKENDQEKRFSEDIGIQMLLVRDYLISHHNIVWNPIFKRKK